ncbi:PspC domain-containing protein [Patescibacteria group bacterium]|nr:MAG: PspC domain-containing protein [Patescibacteria group bacterium]
MATKTKKLTLSKDKKLSGVCGGIAEYFEFDPTIVRLGMAFFILVTGVFPGLIFYVVAAIVMPEAEGAK